MKEKIIEIIDKRLEQLSRKQNHYLINMGSIEEPKEEKIYHMPGRGNWCFNCIRIKELKRLKKEIKSME